MSGPRAGTSPPSGSPFILPLSQVTSKDLAIAGGKGASLGEMINAGVPVPPGFVVTTHAYRSFMERDALYQKVEQLLGGLDIHNASSLQQAATEVQKDILAVPMPEDLCLSICQAYEDMGHGPVAVRSSATAEDLPTASFAGQQRTFLNVVGYEDLLKAVQACWASLFEARAIFYREANDVPHMNVAIAVPVQRMAAAESSGVMFTLDPTSADPQAMLIEAIFGLGEPLASGETTPDAYVVSKADATILKKEIALQTWKLSPRAASVGHESGVLNISIPAPLQRAQKLDDACIQELARMGLLLEHHYGAPQDVEWALEGGKLLILQSRPITTLTPRTATATPAIQEPPLVIGSPASPGVAAGPVRIVRSVADLSIVRQGDVLVAEMTTPDFVPAMKRVCAIVTDRGGRTCHAAIVSREMGIPCVVGAGNATSALPGQAIVTVDGAAGKVYAGNLLPALRLPAPATLPHPRLVTRTRVYVNLAAPEAVERVAAMDVDGVGLLRAEFILAHIGKHPRAMLKAGQREEFILRLADDLAIFARAFSPRPVVYRFSDFKTNEYRNLKGGDAYEPREENPMLGYRGCARYLVEPDLFAMEVDALRSVRRQFKSVWAMLPFVRTVEELKGVKALLETHGLSRSPDFKLWMMAEVPSNVLLLEEFLAVGVDGVSIGSNDLTQLILGVDRDNERLAATFDERNPAVLRALETLVKGCKSSGVTVSICGQAPSVYPELARTLVSWGVTSLSVSPDAVAATRRIVYEAERG